MRRALGVVALIPLLVVGCFHDTADINELTERAMQETFTSDPKFSQYHLQVDEVKLVSVPRKANPTGELGLEGDDPSAAAQYQGVATIHTPFGTDRVVSIQVTAEDDRIAWQAAPGSFLFLAKEPPTDGTTVGGRASTQSATPDPVETPVRDGPTGP